MAVLCGRTFPTSSSAAAAVVDDDDDRESQSLSQVKSIKVHPTKL